MVWCRYPAAPTAEEDPAVLEPAVAHRLAAVCIAEEPGDELANGGRGEEIPAAAVEDWNGAAASALEEYGSAAVWEEIDIQPAAWPAHDEPASAGEDFSPSGSFATVKRPSKGLGAMGAGSAGVAATGRDAGSGSGTGARSGGSGSGAGGGGGAIVGNGTVLGNKAGSGERGGTGKGTPGGGGGRGYGAATRDAEPCGGNPKPEFPQEAQRKNQAGLVVVRVEVRANGRAGEVRVVQSSGFALLDDSALEAARKWTFRPAQKEGLAVRCEVEVPFQFKLMGRR